MTRDEHIEWCKKRALEYLDANDLSNAFASMIGDMKKHPETENHPGLQIGVGMLFVPHWIATMKEVRRWIEGFR